MNIPKTNGHSITQELPKRTWTIMPPRAGDPAKEFVYFAYSAGRIKIGYSRSVDGRHKRLMASGAFPPIMILIMHGTMGMEQDLHVRFHKYRLHGEWFNFSQEIRDFIKVRLCDIGRASLDAAELDYRNACEAFISGYQTPPRRAPRKHCEHGMPLGPFCAPCERERDLAVLDRLRDKAARSIPYLEGGR